MKQGLLIGGQSLYPSSLPSFSFTITPTRRFKLSISAALESTEAVPQLTARERRRLRNERRESKATTNWREEVEERLLKKPKKTHTSWKDELNLDNLAKLGPQWWVVRVSRLRGQEIAERLARSLARNFPETEFKVYSPAVQVKRRLKNGSFSIKPKPLFPGCMFLWCVLNKELHDFIKEYDAVGGFIGSKVGNTKRQINKPRPVSVDDIEAIFQQAKEEQEKTDKAFAEMENEITSESGMESKLDLENLSNSVADSKPKRQSRKVYEGITDVSSPRKHDKRLVIGSTVRIVSGTFAGLVGSLKKLSRKTSKATIGITLFGKESLVNIDSNEIVPETK